ncbi:hypothetical protein [Aliikangiella maris]|uniref:Beta-hydroxyacyl-ACP dehydratase n=2 Tax=Aliikangiella maris TaxID=3162458 RepID=A0ABV3MPP8_9GAMM
MNAFDIRKALPHRYPFLMVDAVTLLEENVKCIGIKNITLNEPCYRQVTDEASQADLRYPMSLIIESFAQVGALLCMRSRESIDVDVDNVMLAGSVLGVAVTENAYPGDVLEHHVEIVKELPDTVVIGGAVKARRPGRDELVSIATVESVVIAIRPSKELFG